MSLSRLGKRYTLFRKCAAECSMIEARQTSGQVQPQPSGLMLGGGSSGLLCWSCRVCGCLRMISENASQNMKERTFAWSALTLTLLGNGE
jgi:hypothetical protein